MSTTPVYDLVIVGGGMVGASLALALGGRGLRMALIEAHAPGDPGQPGYDDRAIALAYGTRRVFEAIGVWPALRGQVEPITDIHVSERGRFGVVRLSAQEEDVPALGYVVNWRQLEPGMVLTVEPGLYIPLGAKGVAKKWQGIGIRIEDDVLVTDAEPDVLSRDAPKSVDEIEAVMAA